MASPSRAIRGSALALVLLAALPSAASAQGTSDPAKTARDAAATWAGFGAAQQLFGGPAASGPAGVTAPGGATIVPAEVDRRDLPPKPPAPANDGILRSAA